MKPLELAGDYLSSENVLVKLNFDVIGKKISPV